MFYKKCYSCFKTLCFFLKIDKIRYPETPNTSAIQVANVKLPIMYVLRCLMSSKFSVISCIVSVDFSPSTQYPVFELAYNTKGINGGKLILENAKAIALLSFKNKAKKITSMV